MKKEISLEPDFLIQQEWSMDFKTEGKLEIPFNLKAEDFLGFAKQDVKEKSLRGDVNAITNVKRCAENRLDCLLVLFGYYEIAKNQKWPFPKKLNILEDLGVVAPQVLQKRINLARVIVEHAYEKPPKNEDIFDLIGICELFLAATDIFVKHPVSDAAYYIEDNKGLILLYLSMESEIGTGKIEVSIFGAGDIPDHYGPLEKQVTLSIGDKDYESWFKLYLKLAY